MLVGDFNAHNRIWNCRDTDSNGTNLLESLDKYNLIIHNNNTYTHVDPATGNKSNIDLAITTMSVISQTDVTVFDDTIGSDHAPIELVYHTNRYIYNKKSFKIQSVLE